MHAQYSKNIRRCFIFQLTYEGINFDNMSNGILNPYAFLLHDSVWNLISSVGTRSNSHTSEVTSSSVHDSSKVYAYHNLNSTARLIGIYDGTSNALVRSYSPIMIFPL